MLLVNICGKGKCVCPQAIKLNYFKMLVKNNEGMI